MTMRNTRTAAEVNGVPFESVTPAMRRSLCAFRERGGHPVVILMKY